jgi:hypothetical protein
MDTDGSPDFSTIVTDPVVYDKEYLITYSDKELAGLFGHIIDDAEDKTDTPEAIQLLADLNATIASITISDKQDDGSASIRIVASVNISHLREEIAGGLPDFLKNQIPETVYIAFYGKITANVVGDLVYTHVDSLINDKDDVMSKAIFKVVAGRADIDESQDPKVAIGNKVGEGFEILIGNLGKIGTAETGTQLVITELHTTPNYTWGKSALGWIAMSFTSNSTQNTGAWAQENGIRFVIDAAQTAGVIPVSMKGFHADALCFPGHKGLLGPQGIGGFIITDEFAKELEIEQRRSDGENIAINYSDKKFYEQFFYEYNSSPKFPVSLSHDARFEKSQQIKKLKSMGIEMTENISPMSLSEISGNVFNDKNYVFKRLYQPFYRKVKFKNNKKSFEKKQHIHINADIISPHPNALADSDKICCPECGRISTLKQLESGCENCGRKSFITNHFPKVKNFHYKNVNSISIPY